MRLAFPCGNLGAGLERNGVCLSLAFNGEERSFSLSLGWWRHAARDGS